MKLKLATSALILATLGGAAVAQGQEGQQIGYSTNSDQAVTYSTRNAEQGLNPEYSQDLQTFLRGHAHAGDKADRTITVYPTSVNDYADDRIGR